MGQQRAARRQGRLMVLLAVVLVAVLVAGVIVGARVIGADPAWGDDRPAGHVTGGEEPDGTRREPAQAGESTLHWATRDGGAIALSVDRTERIDRGARDLVPGWDGPAPCQEYFLVEMTVQYTGEGAWSPAQQLVVLRMTGPFRAAGASTGEDLLAEPLMTEDTVLRNGDSATGAVVFTGGSGTDWSGNLVLSTRDGGWMHVRPSDSERSARC